MNADYALQRLIVLDYERLLQLEPGHAPTIADLKATRELLAAQVHMLISYWSII